VIGPVLASMVIRWIGPSSLFAFTAAVHAAMTVYTIHRIPFRAPAPEEAQIAFRDAIVVAVTTSTVDPLHPSESQQDHDAAPEDTEEDRTEEF
jgi:hypothetical protein